MALKGQATADLNAKPTEQATEAPKLQDSTTPWTGEDEAQGAQTSQAVAPASQGGAIAPRPQAGALATAPAESDGFDDLDGSIGFGSFPIVKLDKTEFDIEGESVDEFEAIMLSSRKKWLYKGGSGDDAPLAYSYDQVVTTGNLLVENVLAEWRADGLKVECKEYHEVVAKLLTTKKAGSLVLLSIPPASVSRLAGYRAELRFDGGLKPNQVVTRCHKGPKVTLQNGKITFYPWAFSKLRLVSEQTQ